jgi:hypothetical protein
MKKQTKANWQEQMVFAAIATVVFICAASSITLAQDASYKVGDRVECSTSGTGKYWMKGTITPFVKGDFGPGMEPDGSWYHFKADANGVEYPCKPEFMRPLGGTAAVKPGIKVNAPAASPATNKTVTGMGDFLDCPIAQKKGSPPNAALFKKIISCKKGEKAVDEGDEGAVKVEVSAIEIGSPRPWSYSQDSGTGKVGTKVYPVKATFTIITFYRRATEMSENARRILNFYINSFGEWEIGSEQLINGGKFKRIDKDQ